MGDWLLSRKNKTTTQSIHWVNGAVILLLLTGVLLYSLITHGIVSTSINPLVKAASTRDAAAVPLPQLIQKVRPGVVQVITPRSSGSGFIFDSQGLILTNSHVVESRPFVQVVIEDSIKVPGRVLGVDNSLDLALIQVEVPETKLTPMRLGNSASLQVGEEVLAIGYPLSGVLPGEATVSRGIVSAWRSIGGQRYVQSDTATNLGNSGGPLVDMQGYAVGVVTAKIEEIYDQRVDGISLAIPIDQVKEAVKALLATAGIAQPGP